MTNAIEKRNPREDIYQFLDRADKVSIIGRALESTGDTKIRAERERDKYGLDSLLNDPFYEDGRPRYTKEQLDALSEEDRRNKINEALTFRQARAMSNAIEGLKTNLDSILRTGDGKYIPSLARIANVEEVRNNTPEEYVKLANDYGQYAAFDEMIRRLNEKKPLPKEREEFLKKATSAAASRKQYDLLSGRPEKLRELGAQLAALAPSEDISREELIGGAETARDEVDKKLKKEYGDDYKNRVSEGVSKAISKLVKSGNPEKEQIAMSLLYKAEKGYSIGERDFSDLFKPEEERVLYKRVA